MGRSHYFAVSAATLAIAISAPSAAVAQEQTFTFDIPAQDLGSALRSFATTSRQQLSFDGEMVRGKRSSPLKGSYSVDAGLGILLRGTGLTIRRAERGVLILTPVVRGPERQQGGKPEAASAAVATEDALPGDQVGQEIVVTGTHIKGQAPSGAHLIVLSRGNLESTGRSTVAEAIQTLPQMHGAGPNDASIETGVGGAPNFFGRPTGVDIGASSLNLRGLGVEETLTLVNGRRLAPAGFYGAFADLSGLPMAAVERVEILADSASATYGADAMAGVINIVMDRRYSGAETRLRLGAETRSGQPEWEASQTIGWAFDRGNIILAANYLRRDAITPEGRPFAASRDLRRFGGTDWRSTFCNPGNIVSPGELAGAIPAGQDGRTLTPDQIRAGETNRCNLYPSDRFLTPETERGGLYLAGSYDATDRLRLSIDILASRRNTKSTSVYYDILTVPVTNAFRQMNGLHGSSPPLNAPIEVRYLFTELEPLTKKINWSLLASAGLEYDLADDWQVRLESSYGRYDSKSKGTSVNAGRLEQSLASSDPATAFNPFGDNSGNNPDLVASLFDPLHSLQESDYRAATLSLGGSLFELPAGSVRLAVGADFRRESLAYRDRRFDANSESAVQDLNVVTATRNVKAGYAEFFIPLFSEKNAIAGAQRLNLSLSGRYDHYSDFGGTFNPKAGVTWQPAKGIILKGSYGTAFKAPLLTSVYTGSYVTFANITRTGLEPDRNGDDITRVMFVYGGNPDLGPEKGKSWTAGLEIKPARLPGLRLYGTYFNLRFSGRFAQAPVSAQVFAEPAAYAGLVYFPLPAQSQVDQLISSVDQVLGVVPPPNSIEAIIDSRTKNFASQLVDGVDAGANYSWEAIGGTFNLRADASFLSRYRSRLGRSVKETSYVANVGLPAHWKVRGGLGWTNKWLSVDGWVNHVSGYTNKLVQPRMPVSSYTTIDLSARLRLDSLLASDLGNGANLAFYVTNLLDESPPFVNNYGIGYDGANADPVGRRVAMQLTKHW